MLDKEDNDKTIRIKTPRGHELHVNLLTLVRYCQCCGDQHAGEKNNSININDRLAQWIMAHYHTIDIAS